MTVRPIIFSPPMVRALLEGRKMQTRRIAKVRTPDGRFAAIDSPSERLIELSAGEFACGFFNYESTGGLSGPHPLRFAVDDLLWVRESVTRFDKGTCDQHIWYRAGWNDEPEEYWRRKLGADYDRDGPWPEPVGPSGGLPYSVPSIHMPRWASRLTLKVTAVKVERLQDISEADKLAEGATDDVPFGTVWRKIHGESGWDANPWVVALTFDVIKANVDDIVKREAA